MRSWFVLAGVLVLCLASCSSSGDAEQSAKDRQKSSEAWKLVLDDRGATLEFPIEIMDIYLVEDESEPEIFEIRGDGVVLVGEFPVDLHVDYDEAFERLVGREITVRTRGGDPSDPKSSMITIDGMVATVSEGTFTVEKLSGKWSGTDGDRTLHGTIDLRIRDIDGERVVRGRFAAHAVTWG